MDVRLIIWVGGCDNAAGRASTDLGETTDRTGQSREQTSAAVAPRIDRSEDPRTRRHCETVVSA